MVSKERILVIDDSPTILKVVQLVLTKAGYDVQMALDGEEGISRAMTFHPQLVLLDFVMPKLNGYQVCRALAGSDTTKDVPVVLMSAKGDQIGERFVKVMGIVDYITKPFSPESILAVVEHTLKKYSGQAFGLDGGEPTPANDLRSSHDFRAVQESTVPGAHLRTSPSYNARLIDAYAGLREGLAEALTMGDMVASELAEKVRSQLDDATLERLIEPVAKLVGASSGEAALQGNLQKIPIAEVLGLMSEQQQWGKLEIVRPGSEHDPLRKVVIYFRQGKIDLVHAEGLSEDYLIGRYLIDAQAVSHEDLDLQLRTRGNLPIGRALISAGITSDEDVRQALVRQTSERIYEILRWHAGRFRFFATRELPPLAIDPAQGAALGIEIAGVLMEGFRRVDEWHLIEREVDDFDAVYLRNEEAVQNIGRAHLKREELLVLELVNGKNSIKDIVRLSRMGSFEVSKMLFRLLSIKLIRLRVAPVAV